MHVANWAVQCGGSLDPTTFNLLDSIFRHYVALWNQLEEERKLREAEESSLYRYRTETFGSALNEDERDERDIKSRFPCRSCAGNKQVDRPIASLTLITTRNLSRAANKKLRIYYLWQKNWRIGLPRRLCHLKYI